MDGRIIQDLKNSWRNINSSTVKFAQNVPIDIWHTKPFDKRFTTFSWEFACILRTRICYLRAFKTGELDFSESKEVPNKKEIAKWDKAKIIEKLNNLGREIINEIASIDSTKDISFANYLLQHERIHHGKLVLYHSQKGLEIPKTFRKTWGESNFPNHS